MDTSAPPSKIIAKPGGGGGLVVSPDTSKVRVIVRVRPPLSEEDRNSCLVIRSPKLIELSAGDKISELSCYRFDACYGAESTQEELFSEVQQSLASIAQGVNTTIFAYGMTGAGKTHTMQGSDELPGIIPRAVSSVLQIVESGVRSSSQENIDGGKYRVSSFNYETSLSYLEIYNEKVLDLLSGSNTQDLPIREDNSSGARRIIIPGLSEMPITKVSEFKQLYEKGCQNRTTASNGVNLHSSRSHAIVIVKVTTSITSNVHDEKTKQLLKCEQKILTGKLHLIDLAGSEDNRLTDNRGVRMTESTNINTSLFVLGKVVSALNDSASRIPYRDSKLTRLLQDSLGGGSCSIMVANVAPCRSHYFETARTLNFASKSRKIINKPQVHSTIQTKDYSSLVDKANAVLQTLSSSNDKQAAAKGPREWNISRTLTGSDSQIVLPKSRLKAGNTSELLSERAAFSVVTDSRLNLTETSRNVVKKRLQSHDDNGSGSGSDEDWDPCFDNNFVDSSDEESKLEAALSKPLKAKQESRSRSSKGTKTSPAQSSMVVSSFVPLTPRSKEKTGRQLSQRGQQKELEDKVDEALSLYINAQEFFPTEEIAEKISQLRIACHKEPPIPTAEALETGQRPDCAHLAHNLEQVLRILNTADRHELRKLHLIGDKRAELIAQYRKSRGIPIRSVDELQQFGLKEKSLQKFIEENIIKRVDWD